MNARYLTPLFIFPLYAQEAPAASPNAWEKFDQARLNYEAISLILDLMQDFHHVRESAPGEERLPDRATFQKGFRFALQEGRKAVNNRIDSFIDARIRFVKKQLPAADFLPAHAAQSGVQKLDNGLQYDTYVAETASQNYRARRAHKLIARVPGGRINLSVKSMPLAIDDALYEAPRGRAWRFLIPPELLCKADFEAISQLKIKAVEIIAVRESIEYEEIQRIRKHFDSKKPPLPPIAMSTAELDLEALFLQAARAACRADADDRLLAQVDELWDTYINDSEESFRNLEKAYEKAAKDCWKARDELTHLQHSRLTPEILDAQRQIPGTQELPNGILYRTVQVEGLNKPLSEVRFIEEEELGPETYLRVRDRIIAETDLPELLRELAPQLPAATEWQIIIPPALRGEEYDLPLMYRLRLNRKEEAKADKPLLAPDII